MLTYPLTMPTDVAMEILSAYKLKKQQNPAADKVTLFRYILWDRFSGSMIQDRELDEMVLSSRDLADLAYAILIREKPAMGEGRLAQSAREAINRFYAANFPSKL